MRKRIKHLRWKSPKIAEMKVIEQVDKNRVEVELENGEFDGSTTIRQAVDVSFAQAIWPVLVIAQICGIMPVVGVRPGSGRSATFRWRSFRTIYSVAYVVIGLIIIFMYVQRLKVNGINTKNSGGVLFFVFSIISCILFLVLASKWRALIDRWTKTDDAFMRRPYALVGRRLSTKIRTVAAIFILLALSEHTIYLVQKVWMYQMQIERCKWTTDDYWQVFVTAEHNHIFERVPYNVPLAIVVIWINTTCIIGWSYADIFIMLISIGLATRFKQINQRLDKLRGHIIPEKTWNEVRNDYVSVCELLDAVDLDMAPIIVLSCSNNLYFICFQMLNIFDKLPFVLNYLYFWYSLLFLILRTVCVFLAASAIHSAAKRPISAIRTVRTSHWNWEVDRFFDQVTTEEIALSGMKFFHLTRKVLLTMVGTIVTYELVLMQFDKGTPKDDVLTTNGVDDTRLETFCRHVRVRVS